MARQSITTRTSVTSSPRSRNSRANTGDLLVSLRPAQSPDWRIHCRTAELIGIRLPALRTIIARFGKFDATTCAVHRLISIHKNASGEDEVPLLP